MDKKGQNIICKPIREYENILTKQITSVENQQIKVLNIPINEHIFDIKLTFKQQSDPLIIETSNGNIEYRFSDNILRFGDAFTKITPIRELNNSGKYDNVIKLQIVFDRYSLEIFGNNGTHYLASCLNHLVTNYVKFHKLYINNLKIMSV